MLSYNYIYGRVRSKERDLISALEWQRLSDASGFAAWRELLKNSAYSPHIQSADTFELFETGLNNYLVELKRDLFGEMELPFSTLLWKKYDLHNFKILLKTKLGYKNLKKYLIPLGEVPLKMLEEFVLGNEKSDIKLKWKKLLREAIEVYENTQSFSKMDDYLDREYFSSVLHKASRWGGAVEQYYKYQVDLANFRLWLYAQHNKDAAVAYLAQGSHPLELFKRELDQEQLVGILFPGVVFSEDISRLQKNIDEYISKSIFSGRFLLKGILPIIIFFQTKENEIKNLKTLFLRHTKNMPMLQTYLRAAYV